MGERKMRTKFVIENAHLVEVFELRFIVDQHSRMMGGTHYFCPSSLP